GAPALAPYVNASASLVIRGCVAVVALGLLGLACHGTLAASAPAADRLTEFYLYVSLGGVLGAAFVSLLAPLLFVEQVEYIIALAVAVWLLPARSFPEGWLSWKNDVVAAVVLAAVAYLWALLDPDPTFRSGALAFACLAAFAWPVRFGPMFATLVALVVV